ncbi:hypothetical protein ACMYZ8_11060 [Bacteroides sp. KG156]
MEKKRFVGIDVSKKTIDVVYYDRKTIKYKLIQRMFAVVKRETPFVQLQTYKRNTTTN